MHAPGALLCRDPHPKITRGVSAVVSPERMTGPDDQARSTFAFPTFDVLIFGWPDRVLGHVPHLRKTVATFLRPICDTTCRHELQELQECQRKDAHRVQNMQVLGHYINANAHTAWAL